MVSFFWVHRLLLSCLRCLTRMSAVGGQVVDMCVLNHTLFVVDSTGFLRAYVPSHLIEETNMLTEEPEPSEAEEESMSMRELGPALDECVWERYLQTEQEEGPSKELASLSARLGVRLAIFAASLPVCFVLAMSTTNGQFFSPWPAHGQAPLEHDYHEDGNHVHHVRAIPQRDHEAPKGGYRRVRSFCCPLLPHKRGPVGSHGSIRYSGAGPLRP
jgi:hypothetical protein